MLPSDDTQHSLKLKALSKTCSINFDEGRKISQHVRCWCHVIDCLYNPKDKNSTWNVNY